MAFALRSELGLVNKLLIGAGLFRQPPFDMYSFSGIVFAHLTTYSIAVKVMLMTTAFRALDGSIEEASRICDAGSLGTLIRVVLPVLAPPIIVAFLISLIKSLEAFEIELFLGLPAQFSVYSTKIYQLLSGSPPNFSAASILASVVLLMMLPLLILQRWMSTRRNFVMLTGQYRPQVSALGRWRWPLFSLLLVTVCSMSLVPLILQLIGSVMTVFGFFDIDQVWTLAHWHEAFSDPKFVGALRKSLVLGISTALGAVIGYSVIAYCTVKLRHRLSGLLDILTSLPLTLPGILLGFGCLWMVLQVPLFSPLYGSMGVLILVSLLTSLTLGIQVLKANMLQIGDDLEEAGRIVGGTWRRTFQNIMLRLSLPAIIVVGIMVHSASVRSLGYRKPRRSAARRCSGFHINGLTKEPWLEPLLFAVASRSGSHPKILPMIVRSTSPRRHGDVAQESHRQASQRDPEFRGDGSALYRHRHADAGSHHPEAPCQLQGDDRIKCSNMPVGLGTFEAGSVSHASFLGVSIEAALAATLLLRAFTFWLPMLPRIWLAQREFGRS
jgi:ABC-type Fe3+ transport system permease subunit